MTGVQTCALPISADQAGSDQTVIAHFSDLTSNRIRLADYNFLILLGGFLDGDDLGSAQAAALRWRHMRTRWGAPLMDELRRFLDGGGLILGICNGFQLLVKLGLLPALGGAYFTRQVSLSYNDSARYEDRWVTLKINSASPCVKCSNCFHARAAFSAFLRIWNKIKDFERSDIEYILNEASKLENIAKSKEVCEELKGKILRCSSRSAT